MKTIHTGRLRRMRGALILILAAILLFGLINGVSVQAASKVEWIQISRATINFVINGEIYHTPERQQGFLFMNRTYVPLRFAAYAFEQAVDWDGDTWTVTVSAPQIDQLNEINTYNDGNRIHPVNFNPQYEEASRVKIKANKQDVNYVFFGEDVEPPAELPSILYEGTLYVPIRYFADSIGIELDYDETTRTVFAEADLEQLSKRDGEAGTEEDNSSEDQVKPIENGGGSTGPIIVSPPTSSSKSYDSIIKEAETSIAKLEFSCTTRLTIAYLEYKRAKTKELKDEAKVTGHSIMSDCDQSFATIMNQLSQQLAANGYDPDPVVTGYNNEYEQRKQTAMDNLTK